MTGSGASVLDCARELLDGKARDVLARYKIRAGTEGFPFLETDFAALPRLAGRSPLRGDAAAFRRFGVDLSVWRVCDLVAAALLAGRPEATGEALALFRQGDREERSMVLRSLSFLPCDGNLRLLLGEAHRSNDEGLFDAGLLDSDLPARALSEAGFNNLVLKAAFLGRPLERIFEACSRANPRLTEMLLDFVEEREAAGRPVWAPTFRLAARAPVPRLAGHLERAARSADPAVAAEARTAIAVLSGHTR